MRTVEYLTRSNTPVMTHMTRSTPVGEPVPDVIVRLTRTISNDANHMG